MAATDAEPAWLVLDGTELVPAPSRPRRLARVDDTVAVVVFAPRPARSGPVDIDRRPAALRLADASCAFRADVVRRHALRPDTDLDPDLAAPLFAARCLAAVPDPRVAVLAVPERASAPVDWTRANRYTAAPHRFAALLGEVHAARGSVPGWLQHLVLEQLFRYLHADSELFVPTAALSPQLTGAFHDALSGLLDHIDDDAITGFHAADVTEQMRLALLLGAQHRRGHSSPRRRVDAARGMARSNYLFAGEQPGEHMTIDGVPAHPEHHKVRPVEVLGRTVLHERIVWLPQAAELTVDPAGEVRLAPPPPPGRLARYRRIARENRGIPARVLGDLRIRRLARSPAAQSRFRDVWLLMDRDTAAQDNAEHLYRHLRDHEPDRNAWFVLRDDSPDWDRLQRDGFRLIRYGSTQHFVALLNCVHLASSQIDSYVVNPFRKHVLGRPPWRFTFLQHGVIATDLSRWLNAKPIDLMITSTADEQRSIVADGTPYALTDLEVVLTGLARHDRLLRLAAHGERNRLMVMPTWRRHLLGAQRTGNRRDLRDDFWQSDYALAWRALLESDRLRALCEDAGWQICFVPHPNLQDYVDTSPLPPHVTTLRFGDIDVQRALADAAAVVTDYSSLSSEAAYIERPVVYYQFDRDAFFAGEHICRADRSEGVHRYGPVVETADEALAALERIARDGGPAPEYAERMRRSFAFRDGRCCERIAAAMAALTDPT